VPQLRTREFAASDGTLHPMIVQALESVRVLVPGRNGPEAGHRSADPLWSWVREIENRPSSPVVVFSTGSLDLIDVGTAIAKHDFALPAFIADDLTTPADCRATLPGAVPSERVEQIYASSLAPLRTAFRTLRGLGITQLGVLGIGPVTPDTAVYARMLDAFRIPVPPGQLEPAFRRKLVVGLNGMLRRLCDEEGAIFIDRWSRSTHDGEPLPGMRLDGVHYTPEAAAATAADIIAAFGARGDEGAGARGHADRAEPAPPAERPAYVVTNERAIDDPLLAVPYRLAGTARGRRVLEIGGGRDTLAPILRDAGVEVGTLAEPEDLLAAAFREGRAAAGGYDAVIVHDATERLTLSALERFYARAAAELAPGGALIVRAPWNGRRVRAQARPSTVTRQLREAFPHVVVWVANAADPAGSLDRGTTQRDLDAAESVFAYAAYRPFDAQDLALLLRAPEPLPDEADAVVIRDASVPSAVAAGATFAVEVTLENRGAALLASWGRYPVRFASFWTDPRGEIRDERERAPLPLPLEPHAEQRYGIRLTAPGEAGIHGVRIALIQESVRWFDAGVDVLVRVE
jgi:hypothetical protein